MFNKLSPTTITNHTHRRLLIFSMIWFFSGAWIDSSAHTYLIDDIETFFTPWHGVLYSGYACSVLVAMYIKNKMKDYKFDVGVLGAVIFNNCHCYGILFYSSGRDKVSKGLLG